MRMAVQIPDDAYLGILLRIQRLEIMVGILGVVALGGEVLSWLVRI